MHQDAFFGPTVKRFPSYLFCGSFPSEMVIWLEKSPGISSCSQLWLSTSQDKGTLAGERNSRTPTFPHITCDFVLELMQELPQRSSCRQAYLYPRLWDCIFSCWLRPSYFWPKSKQEATQKACCNQPRAVPFWSQLTAIPDRSLVRAAIGWHGDGRKRSAPGSATRPSIRGWEVLCPQECSLDRCCSKQPFSTGLGFPIPYHNT